MLYFDIVRSATPDTVQHVLVKPKVPSQQPRKDALSAALKTVLITKMTTNSSGHLKITLPHLKAKTDALEALSISQDVALYHEIPSVNKILPKITICSVPSDIGDEDIKQCVINKTPLSQTWLVPGKGLNLLFSKTSGNRFKLVIARVTPLVRDVIMLKSALYIGNMRCRTYDRYCWVTRCGRCQRFGHGTTGCRAPEPRCAHCAGTNVSSDCPECKGDML